MFSFPTPKLGDVSAFTIASENLEASLTFYQKLGFREVHRADFPFAWIQISDGAVLIMLREGKQPYIALTYYVKQMDVVVSALGESGIKLQAMPTPDKMVQRYVVKTHEGHLISLVTFFDGFAQPPGPTLLTTPPADYAHPQKYVNPICGIYGEYALPVQNLDSSIVFWENLGMKTLSKREAPYPWAILSDGLSIIGLHQTSTFNSPRLTFFAAQRAQSIEKLKLAGLSSIELSGPSNAVLQSPEGQHINLYSF